MTLEQGYEFLNFWINKVQGAFYTMQELDLIVDRGQMTLYSNLQPKASTSQRIKDSLAPFKASYEFNTTNTVSGYISVPSNLNYMDLMDIMITYTISGRGTRYVPVQVINEDERANRLNSQVDPVTVTSPIAEETFPGFFRLWPTEGNTGVIHFYRRPLAPVFGYNVISGRVIVYDPATSQELEWLDKDLNTVYLLALQSIGINITEQDVIAWSEKKGDSGLTTGAIRE